MSILSVSCITLILISLFVGLFPLSASMDREFTVSGSCSINGVPAQGVNIAGPYGAQTTSYPGGNYSLFIRLPDSGSSQITITASYAGYGDSSKDIDLNQTTYVDFNLLPLPVTYTVSGMCGLNGTLSPGVAVKDLMYGGSAVSGDDGAYQLNISVPYGSTTQVSLVASKSGYDPSTKEIDLNDTLAANFNLPVLPEATPPSSVTARPSAQVTAVPANQSSLGFFGLISTNALPISVVVVLLIILVGAVFYLKRRGKGSRHDMIEPSREDIYKLVTGDIRRTRKPRNGSEHTGGHKKLK